MCRLSLVLTGALLLPLYGCDTDPPFDGDADVSVDATPDGDGEVDGGPDVESWSVDPPEAPSAPALPEPPVLPKLQSWDCPEGWREVVHGSVTDENGAPFNWCEPLPIPRLRLGDYVTPLEEGEVEGDRPICDPLVDGTFPVVGRTDCQPLGDSCPSGLWPEVPATVTGGRIFVLAGASDGDGTMETPFGTIGEAIDFAEPGDVVIIGEGTYMENVVVDRNLTLWGRCVQDTILQSTLPFSSNRGAITVPDGISVTMRNLRFTGTLPGVHASGDIVVEGSWFHGAAAGPLCSGCSATVENVLVDTTTVMDNDYYFVSGNGISVFGSSSVTTLDISSTTFEHVAGTNLQVKGEHATTTLSNVLIRQSRVEEHTIERALGRGILIVDGASTTVRRLTVEGTSLTGIQASTDAFIDVEDVLVKGVRVDPSLNLAYGAAICDGSESRLRRAVFIDNEGRGIHGGVCSSTAPSGAVADLEDIVVVGTTSGETNPVETHGIGVVFQEGRYVLRKVLLDDNLFAGLYQSSGSFTEADDLWIANTRPSRTGIGYGIGSGSLGDAMSLTVRRALVESAWYIGIAVEDEDDDDIVPGQIEIHLEDLTVLNTRSNPSTGEAGHGVWIVGPVEATVQRALLSGNQHAGMQVNAATIDIQDLSVVDTVVSDEGQLDGDGLSLTFGAEVSLTKGLFERNTSSGIYVIHENTTVEACDITIRDTNTGVGGGAGYGLLVGEGAEVFLSRANIQRNYAGGAKLGGAGTLVRMEDVNISDTLPVFLEHEGNGAGVIAIDGVDASLLRVEVTDNTSYGVLGRGEGTVLDVDHAVVSGTQPDPSSDMLGFGIGLFDGVASSISRGLIAGSHIGGVAARDIHSLSIDNVLVEETVSSSYDARFGRGLHAEGVGDVSVTDSQFIGNRDVSVAFFGGDTSATLRHVYVGDSRERECVDVDDNDPNHCAAGRGYGLGSYGGAVVTIDDVEIADSTGAGLQLADGGTVTGVNLHIHGCPVAINLQSLPNEYDWESSVAELMLDGNTVDVDESEMSIPEEMPEG